MTIRQRVKIQSGGTIEIHNPELPAGEEAEVVVTFERRGAHSGEAGSVPQSRPVWERVVEIGAKIPRAEWEKVPADLSMNLSHYLYGASKEEE
jgi:hypothetical protein